MPNSKSRLPRTSASALAALMLPLLLASCGGGSTNVASSKCQIDSISISGSSQIYVAQTTDLSVKPVFVDSNCLNGQQNSVIWSISDGTKATIDNGKLTALSPGEVTVTATTDGKTAKLTISIILPAPSSLVINEIGGGWLEIYNKSQSAENLSDFKLRGASWLPVDGKWTNYEEHKWDLPNTIIPTGGYVFVRSTPIDSNLQPKFYDISPNWIELGEPGRYFSTSSQNGFFELIRDGQSADFVRWGDSKIIPTTSIGSYTTLSLPYVGSLIRTNNNSLELRNFATPGGPNDVPNNTTDNDKDGIPDSAEVPGGHMAGIDLYAMGARAGVPDIFVEVDSMNSTDPGVDIPLEQYRKIVNIFATKGYALHIDRGARFSSAFNPDLLNLGNSKYIVPYSPKIAFTDEYGSIGNVNNIKHSNFDVRRLGIFHYAVTGSDAPDIGGKGEVFANDFFTAIEGGSSLNATFAFMHELGHNLGLLHGGFENVNSKPNYMSIMNYNYAYCLKFNYTDSCKMDYSDGLSKDLNEEHLDENLGWGRSSFFADWNSDRLIQNDLKFDINKDSIYSILKDYNDWGNLKLDFARGTSGKNLNDLSLPHRYDLNVIGYDEQASQD